MSSSLAAAAMAGAATSASAAEGALSEPLLPHMSRTTDSLSSDDDSDGSGSAEGGSADAADKSDLFTLKNLGVAVLATGGMATSASAMIAMPSAAVLIMGGLCALNAPVVATNQVRLGRGDSECQTSGGDGRKKEKKRPRPRRTRPWPRAASTADEAVAEDASTADDAMTMVTSTAASSAGPSCVAAGAFAAMVAVARLRVAFSAVEARAFATTTSALREGKA